MTQREFAQPWLQAAADGAPGSSWGPESTIPRILTVPMAECTRRRGSISPAAARSVWPAPEAPAFRCLAPRRHCIVPCERDLALAGPPAAEHSAAAAAPLGTSLPPFA